jgi:hypothetical protein
VIEEEETVGVNVASVTVSDPSISHPSLLKFISVSRRLDFAEKKEEMDESEISEYILRSRNLSVNECGR